MTRTSNSPAKRTRFAGSATQTVRSPRCAKIAPVALAPSCRHQLPTRMRRALTPSRSRPRPPLYRRVAQEPGDGWPPGAAQVNCEAGSGWSFQRSCHQPGLPRHVPASSQGWVTRAAGRRRVPSCPRLEGACPHHVRVVTRLGLSIVDAGMGACKPGRLSAQRCSRAHVRAQVRRGRCPDTGLAKDSS